MHLIRAHRDLGPWSQFPVLDSLYAFMPLVTLCRYVFSTSALGLWSMVQVSCVGLPLSLYAFSHFMNFRPLVSFGL